MLDEINVYSRNLKFVSLAFIAYWVLQLKPKDGVIHLPLNDFEIMNPQYLPFFSYGILLYCAIRFYQSSLNELSERYHNFTCNYNFKTMKKGIVYKWLLGFCDVSIKNNSYYRDQVELSIEKQVQKENYQFVNFYDYQLEVESASCYTKENKVRVRCTLTFANSPISRAYECDYTSQDGILYKICILRKLFLFSLNSDGFTDYVLPWALFLLAILLSIHNEIISPLIPKLELLLSGVFS